LRKGSLAAAFFPSKIGQWLGPLFAAGAALILLGVIVLTSGIVDLAASTPHPAGWASFLHSVFARSTAHHARDVSVPADFGSPAMVAKGARYYGMTCAHCHAGPGLGQNPIVLSMRPRPQYLPGVLARFSDRELFWIVKHGVKYSAMPAWTVQDRDDEVWSVVSFLHVLPKMSPQTFRTIAYGGVEAKTGADPIAPIAADASARAYTMPNVGEYPRDSRYTAPAIGFDDFAMRGDVTATCARCHGADGAGQPGGLFPNLTLLDPVYFRDALTRFARGTRHSGFMLPVATQLSPPQIDALARYYTANPHPSPAGPAPSPALVALGEQIASQGFGPRRQDACQNCHDINRASGKVFPNIDGQHMLYLRQRMRQFRLQRASEKPAGNPMLAIAARMTDRQIDAVAAYYASRPPAAPRNATK
jgi:cytochrome c553